MANIFKFKFIDPFCSNKRYNIKTSLLLELLKKDYEFKYIPIGMYQSFIVDDLIFSDNKRAISDVIFDSVSLIVASLVKKESSHFLDVLGSLRGNGGYVLGDIVYLNRDLDKYAVFPKSLNIGSNVSKTGIEEMILYYLDRVILNDSTVIKDDVLAIIKRIHTISKYDIILSKKDIERLSYSIKEFSLSDRFTNKFGTLDNVSEVANRLKSKQSIVKDILLSDVSKLRHSITSKELVADILDSRGAEILDKIILSNRIKISAKKLTSLQANVLVDRYSNLFLDTLVSNTYRDNQAVINKEVALNKSIEKGVKGEQLVLNNLLRNSSLFLTDYSNRIINKISDLFKDNVGLRSVRLNQMLEGIISDKESYETQVSDITLANDFYRFALICDTVQAELSERIVELYYLIGGNIQKRKTKLIDFIIHSLSSRSSLNYIDIFGKKGGADATKQEQVESLKQLFNSHLPFTTSYMKESLESTVLEKVLSDLKDKFIDLLDPVKYKRDVRESINEISLILLNLEFSKAIKEEINTYSKSKLKFISDKDITSYKDKLDTFMGQFDVADKESFITFLEKELDFTKEQVDAVIEETDLFDLELLKSTIITELFLREKEKTVELEEFIYSELDKQMSILSYGYAFSEQEHKLDIMSAMYQIGAKAFSSSMITEEEYIKFCKMALQEMFIQDDILSKNNELGVQILDDILSKQGINLTYLSSTTLTDKELLDSIEHIVSTLGGVSSSKAIIDKYISLKKDEKLSRLTKEEVDIEVSKFKQSIYDTSTLYAKGILYYDEDSFSNMSDNDDYEGLGVPLRLKARDPYNDYFSWSEYSTSLELLQNSITGDTGFFDINKSTGIILSKSDSALSKLINNNYDSTSYRFKVDFTVENDSEDNGVGVIVRYFNDTNYMYFMISGGDSDNDLQMSSPMQLYRVSNGSTAPIGIPMNPYYWQLGEKYTIEVDVNDNRIKIWVNTSLQYDIIV